MIFLFILKFFRRRDTIRRKQTAEKGDFLRADFENLMVSESGRKKNAEIVMVSQMYNLSKSKKVA